MNFPNGRSKIRKTADFNDGSIRQEMSPAKVNKIGELKVTLSPLNRVLLQINGYYLISPKQQTLLKYIRRSIHLS